MAQTIDLAYRSGMSTQAINNKFAQLIGANLVYKGFNVVAGTGTAISLKKNSDSNNMLFINGACITDDDQIDCITVPPNTTGSTRNDYVYAEYNHGTDTKCKYKLSVGVATGNSTSGSFCVIGYLTVPSGFTSATQIAYTSWDRVTSMKQLPYSSMGSAGDEFQINYGKGIRVINEGWAVSFKKQDQSMAVIRGCWVDVAGTIQSDFMVENSAGPILRSGGSNDFILRNHQDTGYANLTVNNLYVKGTTVTVDSNNVNIGDNILTLNAGLPSTSAPSMNGGLEINRGNQTKASLIWDEATDFWKAGYSGSESRIITDGWRGDFTLNSNLAMSGKITSSYGDASNGILEMQDKTCWFTKLTGYLVGQKWDTTNKVLGIYNAYGAVQIAAGSGGSCGNAVNIDSSGVVNSYGLYSQGVLTIIKDGDCIVMNKASGSTYNGITFKSNRDTSDFAYIRYYDDAGDFDRGQYKSKQIKTTENSILVIGAENDNTVDFEDDLVLRGNKTIIDSALYQGAGNGVIAEFRSNGAIKSTIDNNGNYSGSANAISGRTIDKLMLTDGSNRMTGDLMLNSRASKNIGFWSCEDGIRYANINVSTDSKITISAENTDGIVLRPGGINNTSGQLVVGGTLTYAGKSVWHGGNFNPATKAEANHQHTYTEANGWFRYSNDANNVKLYGGTRQMVFRTDGNESYMPGAIPECPYVWMFGENGVNNRLMLLNNDGTIWSSKYGYLESAFLSASNTSTQTVSCSEVRVQSTTSTERIVMEYNETEGSLDFTYYTS